MTVSSAPKPNNNDKKMSSVLLKEIKVVRRLQQYTLEVHSLKSDKTILKIKMPVK